MDISKHSIIIIKNNKNEYLQYFDNRWNSYLFLNCKTLENFTEKNIIDDLSKKLNLSQINFNFTFLGEKIHSKFSESAKKEKTYQHSFYKINIKNMPSIMEQKNFTANNINYTWFSLEELENDVRIQQVNSDIVSYIKEFENNNKIN